MNDEILRIVDANLNRASEGVRVLEETARLVWNDPVLSTDLKDLRHAIADVFRNDRELAGRLMRARDSSGDVFRDVETESERSRPDLYSLVRANSRRAAEAVRALEEYGKLMGTDISGEFKRVRFRLYDLEKRIFERFESVRPFRREHGVVIVSVDRDACSRPPEDCARDAAENGAGVILYRDKISKDGEFIRVLSEIVRACRPMGVPVVAADRVDAAIAAGADGVVVGDDDIPVGQCRSMLGYSKIVGRSFRETGLVSANAVGRADFLMVVFPQSAVELGETTPVVPGMDVPVVAVINPRRTDGRRERDAGASGFCVFAEHAHGGNMGYIIKNLRTVLE